MQSSIETTYSPARDRRRSDKTAVWFSRIIRWSLGILFIGGGIYYYNQDGWTAIIFGVIFFITGFLRPKRCLEKDACALPGEIQENVSEKGF